MHVTVHSDTLLILCMTDKVDFGDDVTFLCVPHFVMKYHTEPSLIQTPFRKYSF